MADRCVHGTNPPSACEDWACQIAARENEVTLITEPPAGPKPVTAEAALEALETLNSLVTYGEATFKVADRCHATIEAFIKQNS